MPDMTLDLLVHDVDRFAIIDPAIVLRLARSDGSGAKAWRIALNGQRESLTLRGAPAGSGLILRLTPSRYRDIAIVCRVEGDRLRPASDGPLVTPRRPSEWLPVFTRWSGLPTVFSDLKAALARSARFRLGRTSEPALLIEDAYDGVDAQDESRALAKLCLLNLYSRLSREGEPTTGQPWSQRIQQLFVATRERIVAQVDESCFAAVHVLATGAHAGYHRTPVGDHAANLQEIPGVSAVSDLSSVKTKEDKANLQFTVGRAVIGGQPAFLLDCDIDENGSLLLHAFDLIKHAFNGGTHPLDVHEALRVKFPEVPTGYALEPKLPVPDVTIRVLPATATSVPAAPISPAAHLALPARPVRRIAVLGDSVPWGQGLLEAQKIHTLIAQTLADGVVLPATRVIAHSGATIGAGSMQTRPPVHGEVPRAHPTILNQCRTFPADEAPDVDLVIVNGGINDVDVRFILNPFTDPDDLVDTTERACGQDLAVLLRDVAARFPLARILVLEYYPILSPLSRFSWGLEFLAAVGAPASAFALTTSSGIVPPVWSRIIENCRIFHTTSSAAIRAAVEALGAHLPNRIEAVDPGFRDEHAALAPDARLFGIDWDLSPQDPVAGQRRVACDAAETDPLRREQCYRASAGHPNAAGARVYAEAIAQAVTSAIV